MSADNHQADDDAAMMDPPNDKEKDDNDDKENDDNDDEAPSDVEMEGVDLDDDDGGGDDDQDDDDQDDDDDEDDGDDRMDPNTDNNTETLATVDHDELEAARKERMELMAAEARAAAASGNDGSDAVAASASAEGGIGGSQQQQQQQESAATPNTMEEKLTYLLAQSDVFAHFLAGTVAAGTKRGGNKKEQGAGGSRGKTDRMTEAEEDAQLLQSAQSKRSVIRLDKQPSLLSEICKMHEYQLEGLNWLIKLHCNGINGILADEVRVVWVTTRHG